MGVSSEEHLQKEAIFIAFQWNWQENNCQENEAALLFIGYRFFMGDLDNTNYLRL